MSKLTHRELIVASTILTRIKLEQGTPDRILVQHVLKSSKPIALDRALMSIIGDNSHSIHDIARKYFNALQGKTRMHIGIMFPGVARLIWDREQLPAREIHERPPAYCLTANRT